MMLERLKISLFGDRVLDIMPEKEASKLQSKIVSFLMREVKSRNTTVYTLANTSMIDVIISSAHILQLDLYVIVPCANWKDFASKREISSLEAYEDMHNIIIYSSDEKAKDLYEYSLYMQKAAKLVTELSSVSVILTSKDTDITSDYILNRVKEETLEGDKLCINILYDV